jgi:uncharacterized membrane protein YidH (DUF202 family)
MFLHGAEMMLIVVGVLLLAIGTYLLSQRSTARSMRDRQRRRGRETSLPLYALYSAFVLPVAGLFLILVGLTQVL